MVIYRPPIGVKAEGRTLCTAGKACIAMSSSLQTPFSLPHSANPENSPVFWLAGLAVLDPSKELMTVHQAYHRMQVLLNSSEMCRKVWTQQQNIEKPLREKHKGNRLASAYISDFSILQMYKSICRLSNQQNKAIAITACLAWRYHLRDLSSLEEIVQIIVHIEKARTWLEMTSYLKYRVKTS